MTTDSSLDAAPRSTAAPSLPTLIRTPDQRVRVFVSSTLDELAPERAAAREAITQLHLTPVFFEAGARPYPDAGDGWVAVEPWSTPAETLKRWCRIAHKYANSIKD